MAEENKSSLDALSALCKRRGFIYHSSEIYGGMPGFWDYGPLGCELKANVKQAWWQFTVRGREDVAGLDATIIMHPKIWKASGHLDTFADPMTMCKDCKKLMRADQIKDIYADQKKKPQPKVAGSDFFCPYCGGELTEPKPFNLMFKTVVGPIDDPSNVAYLRPETAQAIFAQFLNVTATSRMTVPYGIAQMGKSFRNEVTPRNYTFRSREFEQMELEFFIRPDEAIELQYGHVVTLADNPDLNGPVQDDWGWEVWHKYWVEQRKKFLNAVGLPTEKFVEYWQKPDELAHYARACVDIEYDFPFGRQELEGIAARSDFDLTQHQIHSKVPQTVFDDPLKQACKKQRLRPHAAPDPLEGPADGLRRSAQAGVQEADGRAEGRLRREDAGRVGGAQAEGGVREGRQGGLVLRRGEGRHSGEGEGLLREPLRRKVRTARDRAVGWR